MRKIIIKKKKRSMKGSRASRPRIVRSTTIFTSMNEECTTCYWNQHSSYGFPCCCCCSESSDDLFLLLFWILEDPLHSCTIISNTTTIISSQHPVGVIWLRFIITHHWIIISWSGAFVDEIEWRKMGEGSNFYSATSIYSLHHHGKKK